MICAWQRGRAFDFSMNLILLICRVFDNENDHDYDDGEGTRSSEPRVTGCIGRLKLTCSITLILFFMRKKIRELLALLKKHGYVDRGGKGSHRNLIHEQGIRITISGRLGSDAKRYQERAVEEAIRRVRDEKK